MSQSELLTKVVAVLEATQTPYMLTGSYASSLQGEPRLSHDIDLVVEINSTGAKALASAFPVPDYYVDQGAIDDAIRRQTQFNLIDSAGGDKVDFWILTNEPFDQSRFSRRCLVEFLGKPFYVSRADDTILMKLRWARISGGSEKQFGDALGVYLLQRDALDMAYMERWAIQLEIIELWNRLKREADIHLK